MAEYIDRNKIPWAKVDNPKGVFWERVVFESAINNIPPADVIERSEYEKLKKENEELKNILADKSVLEEDGYYKTSCNLIKKVFDMDFKMQKIEHSKIDKTIAEIIKYRDDEKNDFCEVEVGAINGALDILKRNIGE